ncbi:hypothetical protein SAMN04488129_11429 [Halomonas daqiaonensis]|uniref:Uncharacterized protein n=1 Tax=Halomonas daqiaonensis TaxID=650850 RepID=A0A1H7SBC6_9GAMM|nr:hypothetical protein SAMN04488129_11429 [Halomonas daqiaonensis]
MWQALPPSSLPDNFYRHLLRLARSAVRGVLHHAPFNYTCASSLQEKTLLILLKRTHWYRKPAT